MNTVEIILDLLKKQNKQQKELTKYLGVGEGTIADWKTGKTKSYKKHIDKIAEFFNVSVDYLLDRETPQSIIARDNNNIQTGNNNMMNTNSNIFIDPEVISAYNSLSAKDKLEIQLDIMKRANNNK